VNAFSIMKPRQIIVLWLAALALIYFSEFAGAESDAERDARLGWWRTARFGLFIHWGPVSLKGTEIGWSRGREVPVAEYDQLYRAFDPTEFNARDWVGTAKDAGCKYLVLTSKHHDGFCLWDSKQTDYTMMSTPFKRDVVKELSDECRRQGVTFCLYHSIADWHHPDYLPRGAGDTRPEADAHFDRYVSYLKAQLAELINAYGPLGVLWFDGEWERAWTHEHAVDLNGYLRPLQPSIIINNRIDKGRQDMQGTTLAGDFLGDYDTPEQRIGTFQKQRPWESCITLGEQWAWKPNDKLKNADECLRTLMTCAGGDGNLLLNVGPMPTGQIEPRQVSVLRQVGQWLRQYGQTIYGTRGGPFKPGKWGASTYRQNKVYVFAYDPPVMGLVLPRLPLEIIGVRGLAGPEPSVRKTESGMVVTWPKGQRSDLVANVFELTLASPADQLSPVDVNERSSVRP
jgi:alpha-L-fucosidase